jgi:hypothetical protein
MKKIIQQPTLFIESLSEEWEELDEEQCCGIVGGGILDGSLNNAQILDNINVLNALVNSNPQNLENNNANTRAQGKSNNSVAPASVNVGVNI